VTLDGRFRPAIVRNAPFVAVSSGSEVGDTRHLHTFDHEAPNSVKKFTEWSKTGV
jgi:hypothetical protein